MHLVHLMQCTVPVSVQQLTRIVCACLPAADNIPAPQEAQKAPGLQRVGELMRVVASVADDDEGAAVRDLLMPLLAAVQGVTQDVVAVHDKAVGQVLGEVRFC